VAVELDRTLGNAVALGAGLGRIAVDLAGGFDHVHAIDISTPYASMSSAL
jgi:methylase of polypeptide subunit release factors